MPFYRKTTLLLSTTDNNITTCSTTSYDDDAASSSASARKFLRIQRKELITNKLADRSKTENTSAMQFMTVKKLQEMRDNALSP
jgi:hypothetical protein